MSGYIRESRLIPVMGGLDWNVKYGNTNAPITSTLPLVAEESILTFRSGNRFNPKPIGNRRDALETSTSRDWNRPLGDYGHVFEHKKVQRLTSHPKVNWYSPDRSRTFSGPVYIDPSISHQSWPMRPDLAPNVLSEFVMNGYGTKAINDTAPTGAQADILVALVELLREGLPSALFASMTKVTDMRKSAYTRALASDYLNYTFGVSPLIREIDKVLSIVERAEKLIRQFARDSGRVVRRKRSVLDETTVLASKADFYSGSLYFGNTSFNASNSTNKLIVPQGAVRATQTLHKRVWFSGAFQYWIPTDHVEGYSLQGIDPNPGGTAIDILATIAGIRATNAKMWNLLPFSWLVDWFVNVGTVLGNQDAFSKYGLVMPYAYVMCEQRLITTYTFELNRPEVKDYPQRGFVTNSFVSTTKQRNRATPYGFGVTDSDLNPIQLSILVALGLSDGRSGR